MRGNIHQIILKVNHYYSVMIFDSMALIQRITRTLVEQKKRKKMQQCGTSRWKIIHHYLIDDWNYNITKFQIPHLSKKKRISRYWILWLVSPGTALLVAFPAIDRSWPIRLERNFSFDITFRTSDLVHFARWTVIATSSASVKAFSIHVYTSIILKEEILVKKYPLQSSGIPFDI